MRLFIKPAASAYQTSLKLVTKQRNGLGATLMMVSSEMLPKSLDVNFVNSHELEVGRQQAL